MKVSVIIPTYNVERYINDCLNSVIIQTLTDIEIICIDDASTDNTVEIIEKFAQSDCRIKLLRNNKNYGPSYTRNVGLSEAVGKYIYFLDSDDMIIENALKELYENAENNEWDVIFFDGTVLFEDHLYEEQFKSYKIKRRGSYSNGVLGQDLFAEFIRNNEWSPSPPRQFWKREFLVYNNLRYENGILHEDELFSFLAIMQAQKSGVAKAPYFIRRFRSNSIMTKEKTIDNLRGYVRCYAKIMQYSIDNEALILCKDEVKEYLKKFERNINQILIEHPEWIRELEGEEYTEKLVIRILEMQNRETVFTIEALHKLQNRRKAVIYGAGKYAKKIFAECVKLNVNLLGFVVSDMEGNPNTLFGYSVLNIERFFENDVAVIIGVKSKEVQKEISEKVKKMGLGEIIIPNA